MKIIIDNQTVNVPTGTTILQAAATLGISIPTMCYHKGFSNHPTCMVCMVKELGTGKIVPSCAIMVQEGMQVETCSDEIHEIRREALELLLSDHVGDCEAPCRRSCPAFMNIPLMNRLIVKDNFSEALKIVREEIALPLVLGYICPAPCEKACHRRHIDKAVSICMLKRFTARDYENGIEATQPFTPPNAKKVAVIGSGPTGLSSAYYLSRMGYRVTIFEKNTLPGGHLRYSIPEEKLPGWALDAEIAYFVSIGITIQTGQEINAERFEKEIIPGYDAVILTLGNPGENPSIPFPLSVDYEGKEFNQGTFSTGYPGIFSCGSSGKNTMMAVRSVAQGKKAAIEADQYLNPGSSEYKGLSFNSIISHLLPEELNEYLQESHPGNRLDPTQGWLSGFTAEEAKNEAGRCLHCDCRKPISCKLRILADEYGADRKRFIGSRKMLTRQIRHSLLIYEPEKCIKCGICVEITAQNKEELGLTFIGRGFDIHVGVPLDKNLIEGITHSAILCGEECPTGSLSFLDEEEGLKYHSQIRMIGDYRDKTGNFNSSSCNEKD